MPATTHNTCACQTLATWSGSPRKEGSSGWCTVPQESAGICCVRTGRCLSLAVSLPEGLVPSPGGSSRACRGKGLPPGPWAGEWGWSQASRRGCGHPLVTLTAQTCSLGERRSATPDSWWSSAELQVRLPAPEEWLRWRGAHFWGGCCPSLGVLCCPRAGRVDFVSFLQVS